jgi:ferredoxin
MGKGGYSIGGGPMAAGKTLKLRIDRDKCQGHNRCKALAPELIILDRLGNASEVGDGTVPPALEEKARLAKANCPEFAVDIIEE